MESQNSNLNAFAWIWFFINLPVIPFVKSFAYLVTGIISEKIFRQPFFCGDLDLCFRNPIVYIPSVIGIIVTIYLFKCNKNDSGKSRFINVLVFLVTLLEVMLVTLGSLDYFNLMR